MARVALELDDIDKQKLAEEADRLGVGSISALVRLLIKQFFANPTIDLQSIKQYNSKE